MVNFMRKIKDYIRQDEFKIYLKNNIINIQNFTKIGNVSNFEIIVYNDNQKIIINGEKLYIKKLLDNEILIIGNYNNIIFEGNNE